MPTHRADTPAVRRSRQAPSGRRARKVTPRDRVTAVVELALPSLNAPKVGIAGALGFATIAAPISGVMTPQGASSLAAPAAAAAPTSAPVLSPAPPFPRLEPTPRTAVEVGRVLPTAPATAESVPSALAAPREVVVTRASRARERPVLPGCDGQVRDSGASNGRLGKADLCTLWEKRHMLRADAAVSLAKLNVAFKARFGDDLCITDSYRSYGSQVSLAARKPGLAARPGTSNHGWGLAVDLCDGIESGRGARWDWMQANAGDYGWANPEWARRGGSGPYEPWHWEFPGT